MQTVKAVVKSGNRKLGIVSTTLAAQASCPESCVFKNGGGCYAERGPLMVFHVKKLNSNAESLDSSPLDVAVEEASAIDAMRVVPGRPLRLHTVGDCSTDEAARTVADAARRYVERGGGPVWTYTHAWHTVKRSSWGDVSVLASCETDADIRLARRRGYAAAVVVPEFSGRKLQHWRSETLLPCPAQTTENVTCNDCRLCMNDRGLKSRGYAIAFAVHGDVTTRKRAKTALEVTDA